MDAGNMNGVVLLDLRKAFDLINHKILLAKLQHYCIGHNTIQLLQSYLSDRTQHVLFKGASSEPRQVRTGVPQGSIVGPLLFLTYMNDMPVCLSESSSLDMFADDSTLTAAAKTTSQIQNMLNNDMNKVTKWCNNNKMAVNSLKTKVMLITTKRKQQNTCDNIDVKLSGENLEVVDEAKLLGIQVDNNLSWKPQVTHVCRKVTKHIALLQRIKQYLNADLRRTFFMAYIQSATDYCLTVWGQSSELHRVRKLQNLALRVIADEPRRASSLPLFKRYRVMPIDHRVDYKMTSLVYKSVNGLAPEYLTDMFATVNETHQRQTRASTNGDLTVPRYKLKIRQNSLAVKGAKLYNECDSNIKKMNTIQSFKNAYYCKYFDNL